MNTKCIYNFGSKTLYRNRLGNKEIEGKKYSHDSTQIETNIFVLKPPNIPTTQSHNYIFVPQTSLE